MVRQKIVSALTVVGIILMPCSYALKGLLGLEVVWVDPTLICGVIAFVIAGFCHRDRFGWKLVLYAFLCGAFGTLLSSVGFDRGRSLTYVATVEPIRLALNLIWFWVCIETLRKERDVVIRWVSIGAVIQFLISAYMYLGMVDIVPVPDLMKIYLDVYKTRQAVNIAGFTVYRVAGTFIESPIYGLFMFSCFVVCFLSLVADFGLACKTRRWTLAGAVVSGIGCVVSLSDQVLLALAVLIAAYVVATIQMRAASAATRKTVWIQTAFVLVMLCVAVPYVVNRVIEKGAELGSVASNDVLGMSGAERAFHSQYGLGLFLENPASAIIGIGPGRYGDYVSRTGYFPSSTNMGVVPVEWLVEFGILGTILIFSWLAGIVRQAKKVFGILGIAAVFSLVIANTFQSNWKWESWFVALAFLYCAGDAHGEHPRQNAMTNAAAA